jgi:hypothetical protein
MLLDVRERTLIGCAVVVALLLYVFGSGAPDRGPPHFDIQDDNRSLVHLADGAVMASQSSSVGESNGDGEAYQKAVETFAQHYSDTINRANPLVHEMLMHSEGADRMTKADIEELGDLLSDMGGAPDTEVMGSYPNGYEDCDSYLRAGATSLGLAADSVGGFNETADMEYLRDYRRLIAMYMRAAADAQWCVSDHLHLAVP